MPSHQDVLVSPSEHRCLLNEEPPVTGSEQLPDEALTVGLALSFMLGI